MMTLLYLPSLKLLHWFYAPSMILLTYFYILATDEKVKNGHKSWSIRHFDDKSRQSYFDCVSFTRACLKNEMTKQRNGEMTFLKCKNKWLPLFCRVQLLCLCLPWTGKTLLSMLMQDLTNLVVPSQLSQSLVLSSTKDLSSPQGLLGFVSFYTPSCFKAIYWQLQ